MNSQHLLFGDQLAVGLHQFVTGKVQNERIDRTSRKNAAVLRRKTRLSAHTIQIVEHDSVNFAGKRFGEVAEVEPRNRLARTERDEVARNL